MTQYRCAPSAGIPASPLCWPGRLRSARQRALGGLQHRCQEEGHRWFERSTRTAPPPPARPGLAQQGKDHLPSQRPFPNLLNQLPVLASGSFPGSRTDAPNLMSPSSPPTVAAAAGLSSARVSHGEVTTGWTSRDGRWTGRLRCSTPAVPGGVSLGPTVENSLFRSGTAPGFPRQHRRPCSALRVPISGAPSTRCR